MKTNQSQKNISNGWQLMPVSDVFIFIKSYAFSRDNLSNGILTSDKIGNIHYGDIHATFTSENIDLSKVEIPTVKETTFNPKKEDLLIDGDLIMADASEDYDGIGVTISVHGIGKNKVVGGLHTFVLRDRKGKTSEYYRQYIFLNTEIRNKLQKVANGVSVYGISKTALSKVDLLLPSLPEQNRIVAVLETWDRAIEKLGKKIEAKKEIKKGLMQDLLTGKKRLSGFKDKWGTQKIGDVFALKKGSELSKEKLDDSGKFECILYGQLYTTYDEVIDRVKSRTNTNEGTPSQAGDILIPASTTTGAIDLAVASSLEHSNVLLGGDINILRSKNKIDSRFFAYYLTHAKKHNLARLAQGVTIVHLYSSDFKNIEIEVPEIGEQAAIANILTTAEKEIAEMKQKLSLLKDQKKYLLNNLITGTIRTPETLSIK